MSEPEPAPLENERCYSCTRIVHASWSFCPSCGEHLEDGDSEEQLVADIGDSVYVLEDDRGVLRAFCDYEVAYQEATGYPSGEPHDWDDDYEETPDIEIWYWTTDDGPEFATDGGRADYTDETTLFRCLDCGDEFRGEEHGNHTAYACFVCGGQIERVETDGGRADHTDAIGHWTQDIHQGDAVETLAEMPESSVHTVVTSPPYFGLRDYGVDGQIGLENSLDQYIAELLDVASELRRVLRDDGSWWLNLGDTFAGSGNGRSMDAEETKESQPPEGRPAPSASSFRAKSKMLVPHRVAIALEDQGWLVRSDAVWVKPNPMPHPVKDRLHEHKEFLFHLTPEPDYWFDLDAIREPAATQRPADGNSGGDKTENVDFLPGRDSEEPTHNFERRAHPNGKNPGDILDVPVKSFPEAHFAVYPPELVQTPIKASCPPTVCAACGTPYERLVEDVPVWERNPENIEREQLQRALERYKNSDLTEEHLEAIRRVGFNDAGYTEVHKVGLGKAGEDAEDLAREAKDVLGGYFREFANAAKETDGWQQSCDCETEETKPGIVLDPFAGAGTTALVAKDLGRQFVGIDLNPEYIAMAQKRVGLTVDEPDRLLEDDETSLAAYADGGESSGE